MRCFWLISSCLFFFGLPLLTPARADHAGLRIGDVLPTAQSSFVSKQHAPGSLFFRSCDARVYNRFMKTPGLQGKAIRIRPGSQPESVAWGFYAHQLINRLAVFTLPPEMLPFYKRYIQFITEEAVNPDRRRYAVEGEAERHYIDIDVYGDSAHYTMPRYFGEAVDQYTEDTLRAYGIVPWHVYAMKHWLTRAMEGKDAKQILRLSADMGHYIADAHVPLHTTRNYNGQLTNQKGIHGFWESRLPELFAGDYNFFTGRAAYIDNPQQRIWQAVIQAHEALDSVLVFEKQLSGRFDEEKKYSYEERNGITVKVYSREFASAYQDMLQGQVERQMRASVKMIGDFWYSCWIDAGQPDLWSLVENELDDALIEQLQEEKIRWEEGVHPLDREREGTQ